MGNIKPFKKEKLITGIIYNSELAELGFIREKLSALFGPVDIEAGPIPFIYTTYYHEEMGKPLMRVLFSYENPVQRIKTIRQYRPRPCMRLSPHACHD